MKNIMRSTHLSFPSEPPILHRSISVPVEPSSRWPTPQSIERTSLPQKSPGEMDTRVRRVGGPIAEARNDREGFFSRARDRFTVTSYVSALHIPGPCPETIWIPNTSYHNRRFKVPGDRWSRIPNQIIGPGSRSYVRSRIRSTLGSRSTYRPIVDQILPFNLGQLFLTPKPTPFFDKRDLLTYVPTGNPRGMYVKK